MHLSVYLPLLLAAAFGLVAPVAARALPPAVATWLLTVGAVAAAAGTAASLALLGFTLVGQAPTLAAYGHWSGATLRYADPVSTPVAAAALLALALLAVRFGMAAVRRLTALRAAYRLAAELPTAGGELAVLGDDGGSAYAVPGRPGRIVVSAGLLRRLDAAERRALLAHERSHLIHRHHVHQTVAVLAAAANPLLARLPAAVALATERWSDEDAAAAGGRRDTVAALLSRGVAGAPAPTLAVVLAAAAAHVATRVRALGVPAPTVTLWRVGVLLGLVLATAAAVLEAAHDTERIFELAQFAYRMGRR